MKTNPPYKNSFTDRSFFKTHPHTARPLWQTPQLAVYQVTAATLQTTLPLLYHNKKTLGIYVLDGILRLAFSSSPTLTVSAGECLHIAKGQTYALRFVSKTFMAIVWIQ